MHADNPPERRRPVAEGPRLSSRRAVAAMGRAEDAASSGLDFWATRVELGGNGVPSWAGQQKALQNALPERLAGARRRRPSASMGVHVRYKMKRGTCWSVGHRFASKLKHSLVPNKSQHICH